MADGKNQLSLTISIPSGATAHVVGTSLNPGSSTVSLTITEQSTTLSLVVTAQDGVSTSTYALVITCGHCSADFVQVDDDTGGGSAISSGGQDDGSLTFLGSSFWLMLVLLVAASTLCSLSLLVCVRMQFIRAAQRRALRAHQRRNPPLPVLTPEQLIQRLSPFMRHRKGVPAEAKDEVCAICIGDFEDDEDCTELGCHHFFHKQCINGWLQHKGLAAPCPLCKRLVAPSLVNSMIRQQQDAAMRGGARRVGGAAAAAATDMANQAIELQDFAAQAARQAGNPNPNTNTNNNALPPNDPRAPQAQPQAQRQMTPAQRQMAADIGAESASAGRPSSSSAGGERRASTPEAWGARPESAGDVALSMGSSPAHSASSSGRSTPRRQGSFSRRSGPRIAPATPMEVAQSRTVVEEEAVEEVNAEEEEDNLMGRVGQWIAQTLTPETSPANTPVTTPFTTRREESPSASRSMDVQRTPPAALSSTRGQEAFENPPIEAPEA